jgi:GT2 family glycosyltransferase
MLSEAMEKSDRTFTRATRSNRSMERVERVAGWCASSLLRRVMPTALRDALRQPGTRILARYATRHLPGDKEFDQSVEDASASAFLSIIVPIHDAPEVTRRCLMSLQKYAPKAEIILVDDASTLDETVTLINDFAERNNWKLIRHLKALGHSEACGAGAGLATRPYLCLLNSDTIVTPWCWRPILQAFEKNPEIGIAGPPTSLSGTSQTLPLAFAARHSLNDSQICEYARRLLTKPSNTILKDLPWVSGFALFIRRSLWEHLDGFDRNLVDLGNDVELCTRVLRAGYRVVWVRNSYIHHLGGASYGSAAGHTYAGATRVTADYLKQRCRSCDL